MPVRSSLSSLGTRSLREPEQRSTSRSGERNGHRGARLPARTNGQNGQDVLHLVKHQYSNHDSITGMAARTWLFDTNSRTDGPWSLSTPPESSQLSRSVSVSAPTSFAAFDLQILSDRRVHGRTLA
jgi:hypothetical protein